MKKVNEWIESVCTALRENPDFSGVLIGPVDPRKQTPRVAAAPQIMLEQGAVTVKNGFLGDPTAYEAARRVSAAVRFHIDAPFIRGASCCGVLFSALCEALLFSPEYGVVRMTAGPVTLSQEKHSFRMDATAFLELELSREGGV